MNATTPQRRALIAHPLLFGLFPVFSLLSAPPAYLEGDDEDLVRFFIAMRSGAASQGGSATEPKGKVGAILLQMLLEQDKLLWANSWADMANGLIYPLQAGPVRIALGDGNGA